MVEGTNLPPIQTSVFLRNFSLRSRRLGVVGTRKNGRARRRHARGEGAPSPLACLPRARPLLPSATLGNYICRSLKTYNFQTWQFYYFQGALFSRVNRFSVKTWKNPIGRVYSAGELWVQVPIPFFSKERNFRAVRRQKEGTELI